MKVSLSRKTLHSRFVERVEEISGQNVRACYQCGKCSAGCPTAFAMEVLPNQVIRFVQLGMENEALNNKTIWLCASCLTCAGRCPKGVNLAQVMDALRAIVLRRGTGMVEPANLSPEDLDRMPQQAIVSGLRKFSA